MNYPAGGSIKMRTQQALARLACCLLVLVMWMVATRSAWGSTAAFCGKVTATRPVPNRKDPLLRFTVKIDYFDYISWGKFNRNSKVGESITRQVKQVGSACMINGRLVNAATFVKAIRPGYWGYFYEDTWLDLQTTPDFQWGEVVSAGKNEFTLRVHRTHKKIHLNTNPPVQVKVSFDAKTTFRLENQKADAASALKPGHWVQVHKPRSQLIAVWSKDAAFQPKELQPVEEGRRGLANDLTCPAVLHDVKTQTPDAVLDLAAEVTATRQLKGKEEKVTFQTRKVSFVLDGKLAPVSIAAKPGRHVVLCHYRKEKKPHKIIVRSHDDAIRGTITSAHGKTIRIKTVKGEVTVPVDSDARYQMNGRPSDSTDITFKGNEVVVYPKRGRTCISFVPLNLK